VNLQELPWLPHAECRNHPHVDFFPMSHGGAMKAKAVCRVCPVRVECLTWALEHEFYGVWGGTSEKQRRTLRREKRVSGNPALVERFLREQGVA
jgi:WhiB family redox-sensing transcriptional regulator